MEIFSFEFFGILMLSIAILSMRARKKKKGSTVLGGKQISISGVKLTTFLSKDTPLPCLLDDGKKYGADYKEKSPPPLPHGENCQCRLEDMIFQSREWFQAKNTDIANFQTDLGELEKNKFRYYKYQLITDHNEADEAIKLEYRELANYISINPEFKRHIADHLKKYHVASLISTS